MPLPDCGDKAAMRALDPKCASRNSADSGRTVAQLAEQSVAYTTVFCTNSCIWDLGNLVRCALEAKISADTRTPEAKGGMPMLVVAAQHGSTRALKALLVGGANKELSDKDGTTALAWAARRGLLPCVLLLLEAGANANAQDNLGNTPLMEAVAKRRSECAQALLPVSNLTLTNYAGKCVFHCSVYCGSEECFEMLLPLMSDVDVRTQPGFDAETGQADDCYNLTALHIACDKGLQPMAKALVKRGASRMARDARQQIPLHYATAHGNLSCVLVLVGRPGKVLMTPAEVDTTNSYGFTSLHAAAAQGLDEKIAGVLIQAGARLDAKSIAGHTPLMLALRRHPTNPALLALLSGAGPAQLPGTVCDHCGKTAAQASVPFLKTCGSCYGMRYCGAVCSAAAWPEHKAACKARVKEREEKIRLVERPGAAAAQ